MGLTEIRALKGASNLYPNEKAAVKEIKVKSPKPLKPIKKRGDDMRVIMTELGKLVNIFLTKHKNCEIQGPECTGKATCVHHSEGRLRSKILDVSKFVASCSWCNGWVERADGIARKKGFKKSKF